jgi:tetratricopeptide (TPR) repeat protein
VRSFAGFLLLLASPAVAAPQSTASHDDSLGRAAAAYAKGDMEPAIRAYREFLAAHPDAAEIRSNLGAALVRDGKFAEAIDEYQKALQQVPNNAPVRMNLALAYYKLGRIGDAAAALQALHRLDPLELKPALLLSDCYLQMGQPERAVELLNPLFQEYPEDHGVVYMLGTALLKQGRTRDAQSMLDGILRDGESAESFYLLGQAEFLGQQIVPAAGHLAKAVELNPALPGVHSLYGQILRGLTQLDAAALQFREELKVNAYDFIANTEVAMMLKQEGKFDEALLHIGRALQVRPSDPGALYQRASVHLSQGNPEKARAELEDLVRDYPGFAEAHAALATAYYRLKRPADGDRERAAAQRAQSEAARQPKK